MESPSEIIRRLIKKEIRVWAPISMLTESIKI